MPWKNYKVFVLVAFIFMITGSYVPRQPAILIRADKFYSEVLNTPERGILVSCIKCTCFDKVMKQFSSKPGAIFIATDTNCNKLVFADHMPQSRLDNISEDFYNVVLFKKKHDHVICRIVETWESRKFGLICKDFFRNE